MGRTKPKRRKYTRNYRGILRLGNFSLFALSLILFFLITVLFLIQSNRVAVRGYEISELEKEVAILKEQNEKIQLEASKYESVNRVREELKNSNMVPIKQINYVYSKKGIALKK
ncbi:MAG: hypothetical protein M1355_02140 [Patescibacteria group bacterium]|nr:hypothetical protein [Patescibacteria group bacterium]